MAKPGKMDVSQRIFGGFNHHESLKRGALKTNACWFQSGRGPTNLRFKQDQYPTVVTGIHLIHVCIPILPNKIPNVDTYMVN